MLFGFPSKHGRYQATTIRMRFETEARSLLASSSPGIAFWSLFFLVSFPNHPKTRGKEAKESKSPPPIETSFWLLKTPRRPQTSARLRDLRRQARGLHLRSQRGNCAREAARALLRWCPFFLFFGIDGERKRKKGRPQEEEFSVCGQSRKVGRGSAGFRFSGRDDPLKNRCLHGVFRLMPFLILVQRGKLSGFPAIFQNPFDTYPSFCRLPNGSRHFASRRKTRRRSPCWAPTPRPLCPGAPPPAVAALRPARRVTGKTARKPPEGPREILLD